MWTDTVSWLLTKNPQITRTVCGSCLTQLTLMMLWISILGRIMFLLTAFGFTFKLTGSGKSRDICWWMDSVCSVAVFPCEVSPWNMLNNKGKVTFPRSCTLVQHKSELLPSSLTFEDREYSSWFPFSEVSYLYLLTADKRWFILLLPLMKQYHTKLLEVFHKEFSDLKIVWHCSNPNSNENYIIFCM